MRGENGQNNMRDWSEEIRNWPGPGGVLKRQCGGQLRTDIAVSGASYML
jgi:hypothetical protein